VDRHGLAVARRVHLRHGTTLAWNGLPGSTQVRRRFSYQDSITLMLPPDIQSPAPDAWFGRHTSGSNRDL
jgi:hypothetical protein